MRARRALALSVATVLILTLMIPTVLAAGVASATDFFATASYTGGSGWTSDWTETGESTNPSQGVIQVVNTDCHDGSNCVRFGAVLSLGVGLQRTANFEGAENISLTFRYRKAGVGNLEVRARTGSGSWQAVETLANSGVSTDATVDLSDYAGPTLQIMFFSTVGLLSSAHVDNVSITASYPTTTTTTTSTTSTSTTTAAPIITIPSVTIPPLLTTTTMVSSSTTTTTGGTETSTTTRPPTSTTTSTAPPSAGGGTGPEAPRPDSSSDEGNQATVLPPISKAEADLASDSNIAVDIASGEDFMTFGVNPLLNLGVKLNSTVEVITTEILSALALGALLAFFGVRRIKDDEELRS